MAKGDLTDEQWRIVDGILPRDRVRADGRGRPWSDRRKVLNGVLWVLRTGLRGRICRRGMGRTRRCIGGSRIGCGPELWNECCWLWPSTCKRLEVWI